MATDESRQTYCDWCFSPMSAASAEGSERLGLAAELAWACDSCLRTSAYVDAPDGWGGEPEDWPFRNS